jgi:hypothetical protein
MASSYTSNNGIEKPNPGEQTGTWGSTLNTNFDIIDRVLSGVGSISLSGSTHTLTTTDGTLTDGMYKVLLFTGALGANNTVTISPNDQDKLYFVVNATTDSGSSGPYSVIIKQGSGATVTVANGAFNIVYADGAGSGAAVTSLLANDVVFGDDVSLQSDSAVLNFGADDDTKLTHTDGTGLTLNSTNKLTFGDAASFVQQSSDGVLKIDGEATIDMNASTAVTVSNDLKLDSDASVLGFGTNNDVTLTHVHDTGLLLNSTMQLQFNDASQNITAPSATVLDINATDEVEINATELEFNGTTADINANLDVSGTYQGGGTMTTGGNIVIPDSGNIGSASDTDAVAISSGGVVSFSQVPTFPDDTIETADIQDNAVTLAKMAGLARGKLIYGDASGDPAALAAGSANYVLKSDGTDIAWAANTATVALDDIGTGDAASTLATTTGNITIDAQGDNTDIILKGTDGGADTTFVTVDGSEAGTTSFNNDVKLASDAAVLGFGADNDVTLTHVHDTGITLASGTNDTTLQVNSNADDADAAPYIILNRTSDSPADSDNGGIIQCHMENDNNQQFVASSLSTQATDVSDGTEDAKIAIATMTNGSLTTGLEIVGGKIGSSAYSPAGSVVQVVQSAAAASTTTSTSQVDITNATVDITPQSTSNKVLVLWSNAVFANLVASTNVIYYQAMLRDTTGLITRYWSPQSGSGGLQSYGEMSMIILDSPSTTSSTTYKVQHYVSTSSSTGQSLAVGNYLVAMEIAG